MPLLLESLSAPQIEALSRDKTVFIFPVSPLEDYGPDLPVGLGLQKAASLAIEVAKKIETWGPEWKAVLMTPMPIGADTHTDRLRIKIRGSALKDYLIDSALSLHKNGFLHFTCVSGNLGPKQLTAIEEACRSVARRANGLFLLRMRAPERALTMSSLSSSLIDRKTLLRSPLFSLPAEHGGKSDRSVALALDSSRKLAHSLTDQPITETTINRMLTRIRGRASGYWGEGLSSANEAEGHQILSQEVETMTLRLRSVIEGTVTPDSAYRSGYSLFLPNHTQFGALAWSIALTLVFLGWITWTVQFLLSR